MIWKDSISSASPGLEILTRHIAAEIRSADPDFPESAAMPDGDELARSVAEFVFHSEASERARHANGILIPSDYLLIMTCRALWAVGKERTARALLRTKGPELNIAESYAAALFTDDLFPCLGIHSALIRALRPSSSVWSLNGPYWILNLRTVFSFPGAGLELTVWRILHALLKQLAALWDVSNGKGTLGLRNARFISVNILGFSSKSKQGRQFAAEALRYCEQDLKMAADERRWQFMPAVMDLDA